MTEELKKIYTVLPDEIRNAHPHGQWVFDRPGLVLNFACEVEDEHYPLVEPWARRLADFIASDEPYMEFESPHFPGLNYLHRAAAEHIISTQGAWSAKVLARNKPGGNGNGVSIVDQAGLPVLRKLRN